MSSLEKRFRRKVGSPDERGCMPWLGNKNNRGYGQIQRSEKPYRKVLAHRLSYELHKGAIPEGMDILHSCDNPGCVNPDHLSPGTAKDNVLDMMAKGRQRKSQFSEADLLRMKEMRRNGLTQQEISINLGVSRPLISMILAGKIQVSAP